MRYHSIGLYLLFLLVRLVRFYVFASLRLALRDNTSLLSRLRSCFRPLVVRTALSFYRGKLYRFRLSRGLIFRVI